MLTSERAGGRFARAILGGAILLPRWIGSLRVSRRCWTPSCRRIRARGSRPTPSLASSRTPRLPTRRGWRETPTWTRVVVDGAAEAMLDLPVVRDGCRPRCARSRCVLGGRRSGRVPDRLGGRMWAHVFRDEAAGGCPARGRSSQQRVRSAGLPPVPGRVTTPRRAWCSQPATPSGAWTGSRASRTDAAADRQPGADAPARGQLVGHGRRQDARGGARQPGRGRPGSPSSRAPTAWSASGRRPILYASPTASFAVKTGMRPPPRRPPASRPVPTGIWS